MKDMILDNSKIHYAKLLKLFLEEVKDKLELMFLLAYSQEMNLMEGIWRCLKASIINNSIFTTCGK